MNLKFNPDAAKAIHEAEGVLKAAGLPSVIDAYQALAAATLALEGRGNARKGRALGKARAVLEPLRPGQRPHRMGGTEVTRLLDHTVINAATGETVLEHVTTSQLDRWYDAHAFWRMPRSVEEVHPDLRHWYANHGDDIHFYVTD